MHAILGEAVAAYEANAFWNAFDAGYDRLADNPVQRGEVWLVDFGEPPGHEQGYRRPAGIMSEDRLNRSRVELAVVVAVTTSRRGLPSHPRPVAERRGCH